MKRRGAFGAFLRLPRATRRMALEAALLLTLSRLLVAFVPMRHWRARLDMRPLPTPPAAEENEAAPETAGRAVGRIVERVARRMPFDATCLAQAMASQWMLRRRRIASQLHLGARRRQDGTVALHAWLTVSGECVAGGRHSENFEPLSALDCADRPRPAQ